MVFLFFTCLTLASSPSSPHLIGLCRRVSHILGGVIAKCAVNTFYCTQTLLKHVHVELNMFESASIVPLTDSSVLLKPNRSEQRLMLTRSDR